MLPGARVTLPARGVVTQAPVAQTLGDSGPGPEKPHEVPGPERVGQITFINVQKEGKQLKDPPGRPEEPRMPRHSVESPGVFIIDFAEKQPLSPTANLGGRKLDARCRTVLLY